MNIFLFLNIFLVIYFLFKLKEQTELIFLRHFVFNCTIIPRLSYKIFFMYGMVYDPLFSYQKHLFQNCNSIQEADYLLMNINNFFAGNGYLSYKWGKNYTGLVFSKPIIMMYEENILLCKWFNFNFKDKMKAVIANNDIDVIRNYFKTNNSFIHLMFLLYAENHKSSFEQFINRSFYFQSEIRNINIYGNSKRAIYLKECMNYFGENKTANYGKLYHNQDLIGNKWLGRLPPSSYFGFAIENSIADYWITEKLFFTYRNDVIPIYRGSVKNAKILESYGVNPRAFVDASNMTEKELVKYLDYLINKDGGQEMYKIYKEPLIPNKEYFDSKIISNFQNILKKIS